jgi:hypothetical protein
MREMSRFSVSDVKSALKNTSFKLLNNAKVPTLCNERRISELRFDVIDTEVKHTVSGLDVIDSRISTNKPSEEHISLLGV